MSQGVTKIHLLTKVVKYVSGVTKMNSESPPDPWGPGGTLGGPQGVNLKLGAYIRADTIM